MTRTRLRTAALVALPLTAVAVFSPVAASAAPTSSTSDESVPYVGQAEQVPVLAAAGTETSFIGDDADVSRPEQTTATASFRVIYHNFSPAAKASFQRAVVTWSNSVRSSVPIVIDATYRPLGPGVLGSAGSNKLWLVNNTITVDALTNKKIGRQRDSSPDIIANFSSSFDNWHFGTGPAPKNTYDFQSVVTHEIGHGLGFLGGGRISSGKAAVRYQGYAFGYDKAVENGGGTSILAYANGTAALKNQLLSRNLYVDSPAVRRANNGNRAKVYAPAQWNPGSSYSHLDESTYRQGNKNSLMTPFCNDGESVRAPGPIVRAVFTTLGW